MRAAVILTMALMAPLPGMAQAPTDAVAAQAGACLATGQGKACIGRAAKACMGAPEGQTTLGMVDCAMAERGYWDDLLNRAYKVVMAREKAAGGTGAQALREMQRAWIAYRDARCGFEASGYDGGTIVGPIVAQCQLQMTAEQALYLRAQERSQ
ncbi:DUF1311 domain-containing protein [Thioclava sp. BHET1]|nr:DUF1311 domain-containing protein [Thioclava sp. BHET1]